MKNTSALYPHTTWPTLPSEARHSAPRPVVPQPERDRPHRTFADAEQRQGEKTQTGLSARSREFSQDNQRQQLPAGENSPTPSFYQSSLESGIPLSNGIETLVAAQQFAQPEEPLSAQAYQNRIAAYDHVEGWADHGPQILDSLSDGEELDIEVARRIDLSV